MATFEFWLENIVLERGRAFVEADSLNEAIEVMQQQVGEGDYEASWNYAETLSCRILEVEDEQEGAAAVGDEAVDAHEVARRV